MKTYKTFMSSLGHAGKALAGKGDSRRSVFFGALVLLLFLGTMACAVAAGTQQREHVFRLQYKEVDASPLYLPVVFRGRELEFKKEPAYQGRDVFRSAISIGPTQQTHIPFAWDKDARKLYLDLNNNMDLTDDANGVFESTGEQFFQIFRSIRLEVPYGSSRVSCLVDIQLIGVGHEPYCQVMIRSLWEGEIELQGKRWDLAVVDNLDGVISAVPQNVQDSFVIRPAESREKMFDSASIGYASFSFPPPPGHLFLDGLAYDLDYAFEPNDKGVELKVVFTETEPKLGELRFVGTSIKHLILQGEYVVFLYSPAGSVRVPVGQYVSRDICLQTSGSVVRATAAFSEPVVVTETAPAVLNIGAPLNHKVNVGRAGDSLRLDYELAGVGGKTYLIGDRSGGEPPQFAIYKGAKQLYSGRFQYG